MEQFLIIKENKIYRNVPPREVVVTEACSTFCKIYTRDGKMRTINCSLKVLLAALCLVGNFIQVHRSFIVNRSYIDTFSLDEGVRLTIAIEGLANIPLSETGLEMLKRQSLLNLEPLKPEATEQKQQTLSYPELFSSEK